MACAAFFSRLAASLRSKPWLGRQSIRAQPRAFRKTMSPDASAFDSASFALLSSLLGLAILEHWCLVLPLRLTALWNWWLQSPTEPANLMATDANVEEE
jgi:hypothetical protein